MPKTSEVAQFCFAGHEQQDSSSDMYSADRPGETGQGTSFQSCQGIHPETGTGTKEGSHFLVYLTSEFITC